MTGGRYIKEAIIASLCEHPQQDKYRVRAFSGDSLNKVTEALSGREGYSLSKKDFLTPDENGKSIIDTPGFWKNFEKINDIVRANGDKFIMDDFLAPLEQDARRTLLESAIQYGGLKKLFTPAVWQDRYDEMERLWFRVRITARRETFNNDGTMDLSVKREMYALNGRTLPEDRLRAAGLRPEDIHGAFRERGNFENVRRKLELANDYFRKEYLLLPDAAGDTSFYTEEAWRRYPALARGMAERGERMEVSDFIRQIGSINNVLTRAAERKALDKVFESALWEDRTKEMLELWSHVRDAWKTPPMTARDFDLAYAEAEGFTYGKFLPLEKVRGKSDLLSPLNDTSEGERPVLVLGLKSFWDRGTEVQKRLAEEGQFITLKDLRQESGGMGNSCLISAVKYGKFSAVVDIVRRSGEKLSIQDFLSKDMHGNTVLSLLAERKELPMAFAPDMWIGRVAEMKELWTHVRHADRTQVENFDQLEVAVKQATLHERVGNKFKLGKK